ncbi:MULTISPECIES: methyl-accepting chemotaxis protein [Roseobacteraceae]|uniref:methyl-accepting chemotaxis protein n=1 Tax=Roseobacteraceae TaxID=2854170 RepID=UPI0032978A47
MSLSVSKILLILTASGFFVALAFAGPQILGLIKDRKESLIDVDLARLATSIGDLTHELQKERGASAGFISSNGMNFGQILSEQRAVSDSAINDFMNAAVTAHDISDEVVPFISKLEVVREQIINLPSLRSQIDSLEIESRDAVASITAINRAAIALLPELARSISHPEPAQAVQRHSILMTAKDSAGLERATGAVGFARAADGEGVFPPETLELFLMLILEQEVLIEVYEEIASEHLLEMLTSLRDGPESQRLQYFRDVAKANDPVAIAQITPESWYHDISDVINLLKTIEDEGAVEINEGTAEALLHADSGLIEAISLFFGLMIGVGVCTLFLVREVAKSISCVSLRVVGLADGDIESAIPEVAPNDLKRITEALSIFRQRELETRELKEQQAQLELSSALGIERVTRTVSEGDFSTRLRLRDLQGASKVLGEGLNQIMSVVEEVANRQADRDREALENQVSIAKAGEQAVEELNIVVSACVRGDFTHRLNIDDKEGVFAELCEGVNRIGEVTEGGLSDLMRVLQALALGDLSMRMSGSHDGIFDDISRKINQTNEKLSVIMGQITSASQHVQMSSSELSEASTDLAHRTEKNAASLEEASNSVDDLTAAVSSTSESASEVNRSTQTTQAVVEDTTREVEDMVNAMNSIASSSEEISKITSVIDDISFQTNLLSLNAGVEAARAGEAGLGFAVVATEVRILAQKTAEAAMEIKTLISNSEAQVNAGVEMVGRSRSSLRKIQKSIDGMAKEVAQMVETATHQSVGISDINKTVSEIEQATQKNAAMCEETNAVAQTMNQEANTLVQAIASFSEDTRLQAPLPRTAVLQGSALG